MPKAILFDVDGTLVDTNDLHAEAWAETFRRYGLAVTASEVRPHIGKGGDQLMPGFLSAETIRTQGSDIERFRGELFTDRYLHLARPFSSVPQLFEKIRSRDCRMALASSGKKGELDHYVKLLGIGDLIDFQVTSEDADRSKPCPDIFEAAVRKLGGIGAADVVVVGDSPYDAEAAGAAGLRAIGLLCGGFGEAVLRAAGASAIFADPADLLRNFERSPLADTPRDS